ncbi:hypothetical protein C1752_02867 [Acaryochloris thomasi RCC1774]|uniref:Uncharacterized protein n=1 Tax=Acaryochloris thomasi RCC1774 TaxID=1764569 RepID=A0A2W1JQ71_9CYAN|nr:hypothetical protein [Acaryochloris thomasi]PZD73042.1 hypothetical protein C1752_02867 [Acaryochloris thomasi RCC1774]
MWQLSNPTIKRAKSKFSVSGYPKTSITELWDNDVQIINAVERVNWEDDDLQFQICACGYVGCQPSGWVSIRQTASIAVIIPAFTSIKEASQDLAADYFPPLYLHKKGAIFTEKDFYTNHLSNIAKFPVFEELRQLTSWETSKLFQWEAPSEVLGHIERKPSLLPDIIMASSDGSFIEQTEHLISLIERLLSSNHTPRLRRRTQQEQVISLYLDMAGFPQWDALSFDGAKYSLYLEPDYIIE